MQVHSRRFDFGSGWNQPLPDIMAGRQVAFAYGPPEFFDDPRVFKELTANYAGITVVGCSTSGTIWQDDIYDRSLSVALVSFARTEVETTRVPILDREDSYAAGVRIVDELTGRGLRSIIVYADGVSVDGSALARALNARLPDGVTVSGGLAGNGDGSDPAWVVDGGEPVRDRITAIGLYGNAISTGHGSVGGWQAFGPERTITRSRAGTIIELDGRPALEVYKRYLGAGAATLPEAAIGFPLIIEHNGYRFVRTVIGIDEQRQSLSVAGEVPHAGTARLARGGMESLVAGAAEAAARAVTVDMAGGPVLSLATSCQGRRVNLGQSAHREVEAALSFLPSGSVQAGFYGHGQFAPQGGRAAGLNNQTMTVTAIAEPL